MDAATTVPFRIGIEPGKLLSSGQEMAVLREAHRRRPESAPIRRKLARELLVGDAFDEVIALLEGTSLAHAADAMLLIQAHLSRETHADDLHVVAIVDAVFPALDRDDTRAQFLADQAKAQIRLGEIHAARATLERALAFDPANKNACKRLAAIDLDGGDVDAVIATMDILAADGASHARLHAAQALAHARAGRIDASQAIVAFDQLHYAGPIDTPEDMPSLDAFNTALAAELLDHPDLRYGRYGAASEKTWRIDTPLVGEVPMTRRLLEAIARTAERHVARIADVDHPWVRARPAEGMLHCWAVLTDGEGHETWHVHQFGWLSGVYYVRIPPSVAAGSDVAGCIGFGLPGELAGADAAARYGERIVRPQEGMLMLFPSHSYHRTFPHESADRRICVAFDIWPA